MSNTTLNLQQSHEQRVHLKGFRQERSSHCLKHTKKIMPQGVGSPGRLFDQVAASPIFVSKAQGSRIWDVDGNVLIDFMNGLGPMILGHGDKAVEKAVSAQLRTGTVHALCSELEGQLAGMIVESTPGIDKVRFSCSGTEAVMTAIRLSRLVTKRSKIIKFRGAYHGHSDQVLVPASEPENVSSEAPVLEGIPRTTVHQTIYAEYNDIAAIKNIFAAQGREIAAVLVEPIATNMGLVPGTLDFLGTLREFCSEFGALLVCDEVVNGFRFRYGAFSQDMGLTADLYTFGKIIGGGLPIGALAGPAKFMDWLERFSNMFHSGTFAGNPLSMAAGIATLERLRDGDVYQTLETLGAALEAHVNHELKIVRSPYGFLRRGSLFCFVLVPGKNQLLNQTDVAEQDVALFAKLHQGLLERGILIAPTVEEPGFISTAHSIEDMRTLALAAGPILSKRPDPRDTQL